MGDAYMEQEDYEKAADKYEEALQRQKQVNAELVQKLADAKSKLSGKVIPKMNKNFLQCMLEMMADP